jgi:hypothetical protein
MQFDRKLRRNRRRRDLCFCEGMQSIREQLDTITETIIGGAICVHQTLGPGLLESVYRDCLQIELRMKGLHVESGRMVPSTAVIESTLIFSWTCWLSNASWWKSRR